MQLYKGESLPALFVLFWLIFVNAAAFLCMAADKRRAQKRQWRIPEKQLYRLLLGGGGFGGIAGMLLFRHKTKRLSFYAASFFGMAAALILSFLSVKN